MSWQTPSRFECDVLDDVRQRWPEILPLARLLSLALRIDPLLLRNARWRFLDPEATELESLLWFGPLIGGRSSREVVLLGGVARLLAEELRRDDAPQFEAAWKFTLEHTRHWSAEDRLEQDLRYYCLRQDSASVEIGLRDMLRRVCRTDDEGTRVKLARWVNHALPVAAGAVGKSDEALLLAQFAGQTLGVGVAALGDGRPTPLPDWLAERLPAPYKPARLGVELRYDPDLGRQVLHFVEAPGDAPGVEFPTALPAELHVQCDDAPGSRHPVALDTRIALPAQARRITLTTIDGRRYELVVQPPPEPETAVAGAPAEVYLTHVAADAEHARRIADWLAGAVIAVRVLEEREVSALPEQTTDSGLGTVRLLRLWTRAAQHYWSERGMTDLPAGPRAVLLRAEPVDAPSTGSGAEQLLDILGWDRPDAARKGQMAAAVKAWLDGADAPQAPTDASSRELQCLMAEIEDPATPPPRRLEIGDRLAELGDPREGVGVREYEIDEAAEATASPEWQGLVRELEDTATAPPRRLEIGDRLAQLSDPRAGTGLDARGLPELSWVDIPGGAFLYQGKKRTLAGFRMARYPITNIQYQAFVDAGGYADPRWWERIEKPETKDSRWPQANRPRTNVDWYEAVAFCRWLSTQLGYEVRLPTEEEWERAAADVDGRDYPWGKEYLAGYANADERRAESGSGYLEQTTAVGVYPQGRSAEGVLDLAGNVWEWCLNKYDKPEQTDADTSGDRRVLRGGSWDFNPVYARASDRSSYLPDVRSDFIGFRVVSSSPIA